MLTQKSSDVLGDGLEIVIDLTKVFTAFVPSLYNFYEQNIGSQKLKWKNVQTVGTFFMMIYISQAICSSIQSQNLNKIHLSFFFFYDPLGVFSFGL